MGAAGAAAAGAAAGARPDRSADTKSANGTQTPVSLLEPLEPPELQEPPPLEPPLEPGRNEALTEVGERYTDAGVAPGASGAAGAAGAPTIGSHLKTAHAQNTKKLTH